MHDHAILIVDDLHWADRWSLLVLARIARMTDDNPLVLLFLVKLISGLLVSQKVLMLYMPQLSAESMRCHLRAVVQIVLMMISKQSLISWLSRASNP